jgi:plasmid stabilization system protein ParE
VSPIVFSAQALADLDRRTGVPAQTDGAAAMATAELIFDAALVLTRHPAIGRPTARGLRELVISRGRTGYIALYRENPAGHRIEILALRHQREAGYGGSKQP